jgi:1-deoxy-D-xylulose-5-phosphate reductoisomerase
MKKGIILLGSTGSIGRSTLDAVLNQRDEFEISGLACRENVDLFNRQIEMFRPKSACIYEEALLDRVDFKGARKLCGESGLLELVREDGEIVVNALPGTVGLAPTIETLKQHKTLALANKESLVMAGRLISSLTRGNHAVLLPVDSEHSALYQLMEGIGRREIDQLIITASGGPFRDLSKERLSKVTVEEALRHPTWKMGRKVTIDSATLMNKGLEVIEAHWLFDIPPDKIKVLVHPESIVHGMVQLSDGCLFAYLAPPDMRIPIAFALNGGQRKHLDFGRINFAELGKLTFYDPDLDRFPALKLAYSALDTGDSALVTLNASNEVAAAAFVNRRIRFSDIPCLVETALALHPQAAKIDDLKTIWEIDRWAKNYLEDQLRRINV